MKIDACLSHKSDDWQTPSKLYDYFINYLGCVDTFEYCSKDNDQYSKMYNDTLLFMNPPFSHLRKSYFIRYIYDLMLHNNTVLLLMPVRTDTKYFEFLWSYTSSIYFFKGRLHFNDGKSAPFPFMLLRLTKYAYLNGNHFEKKTVLCSVDDMIKCRYQ